MKMNPLALTAVRAFSRFHASVYRMFGGKGPFADKTLVLTTRGRKSGREVSIPLFYVADGGRLYIVASFGGYDEAPHWYRNLLTHPEVTVNLRDDSRRDPTRSMSTGREQ